MVVTELTRVCDSCGIEKPIAKFGLRKSKRTNIYYRLHTCGVCSDKRWRSKNVEDHGYTVSLHEMERRTKQRDENIELYGFATTPRVREWTKEWSTNRRIEELQIWLYMDILEPLYHEKKKGNKTQSVETGIENYLELQEPLKLGATQ